MYFSHSTHLFLKKKCTDKIYSDYKTESIHITRLKCCCLCNMHCKSKNNYETNPRVILDKSDSMYMKSILENASRLKEAPPPHPGGPLHLPLLPHPLLLPHPPLLPPVPQSPPLPTLVQTIQHAGH